jgi:2'-5' RNA ligase
MHITLRFLGDVSSERQAEVRASAERASQGAAPFTIVAGGTGVFPNARNPRVFWVGIKNAAPELIPLQKRIESELEAVSFGRADKPFSPHLTIGRARQSNAGRTAEALNEIGFADESFVVEEIIVRRGSKESICCL